MSTCFLISWISSMLVSRPNTTRGKPSSFQNLTACQLTVDCWVLKCTSSPGTMRRAVSMMIGSAAIIAEIPTSYKLRKYSSIPSMSSLCAYILVATNTLAPYLFANSTPSRISSKLKLSAFERRPYFCPPIYTASAP
ncbi:hypothetical protein D3C77_433410 [compost metagenome]